MRPVVGGHALEVAIDGEATFAGIVNGVSAARRSIHVTQLLFEPRFVATYRDGAPGLPAPPRAILAEELVAASRRGVRVRVLVNENAAVPDRFDELARYVEWAGAPNFEVRALPSSPNVMHAKMVILDGEEAYLPGPPFEQRFWDTSAHLALEARRKTDRPVHDLGVHFRGPAVADLERDFALLWRHAGGDRLPEPTVRSPEGPHALRVVRTLPRDRFAEALDGDRSIRDGYLAALARAERFAYLEAQYFTSTTITEALARALGERPSLEVILVLNEDVDIPGYVRHQLARLAELGHPEHPRLGVFTLWARRPRREGFRLRPIYVHSKLGIADDRWMTVGAANLDSVSLEESRDFGVPIPANVEANVEVFDGLDGHPETGLVGEVRRRLFAEHLGPAGDRAEAPDGGWLGLWRDVAEGNLRRAERGDARIDGSVLPFGPRADIVESVATKGP